MIAGDIILIGRQDFTFYLKAYTPTVVATSFCVDALLSAYKITQKEDYLKSALSSRFFILNDLKKNFEDGFLLSYAPVDGNNTVYNASLLWCKALLNVMKSQEKKILLMLQNKLSIVYVKIKIEMVHGYMEDLVPKLDRQLSHWL